MFFFFFFFLFVLLLSAFLFLWQKSGTLEQFDDEHLEEVDKGVDANCLFKVLR